MGAKVLGAESTKKSLGRYADALRRETVSILKQEARALAVELGAATLPGPGFNEAKAEKFRATVESEVRRVYASKQDPSGIYKLMLQHAPHLAGAYWAAHKRGKARAAADIVRRAGLPQGLDPGALSKARKGKKGHVLNDASPASLATEAQVRAFARKQRARVGLAKAGWYAAAKGVGGRVRRNLVSASGKRKTEEIFPAYVRKLASKYPGLGGARVSGGDSSPKVEIFTRVKYANDALPRGLYLAAVDRARGRVKRDLELAASALNRKGKRRAA